MVIRNENDKNLLKHFYLYYCHFIKDQKKPGIFL